VRKQVMVVMLLMLGFAGVGSSAVVTRALAQQKTLSVVQQEKRLGPKPTPHWYWRWVDWRLGEGYAKGHRLQSGLRPRQAPRRIPGWAWQRLHLFLLARTERALAAQGHGKKHGPPAATGTTTTSTTSTTTTGTTTTPSGGGETYDQAISYTQTRPSFAPTRTVGVSSASELRSALSNLQPGDLVEATASFTVNGQTRISNRLSAPAELDLTGVSFVYSGGQDYNAVWLDNAQNLYIFGGDTSTSDTGGGCISDYGSQHVLWWGFTAHDCGGDGFDAQAIGGPVDHNDFQGTIWNVGQNLAWDPHSEKGTGLHGANLWDANYTANFTNNRFAFYAHDIPVGACVEFGNDQPTSQATGNTLYLKCVNATELSTTQTGGNALQIWGDTNTLELDVKYLQADNLQGFALHDHGIYTGQTANGVTIEYGRATNTNQNPRYAGRSPWDSYGNVAYKRVRPAP
jgi:hypothetical protein